MSTSLTPLRNLNVLITRPSGLAGPLCRLVEQAGGTATRYPVISIEEPISGQSRAEALSALTEFNIAVFISPSAVRKTFEHIDKLPETLSVAAIGSSTQACLKEHGIETSIHSSGHNSDALLQHSALQSDQISDKNIVIFRGEGGRALLGDELISRGAKLVYAEMYRRALPENVSPLSDETLNSIDVIAVSSNEGLSNLCELCEHSATLTTIPLIVPGERCAQLAGALGFSAVISSENATDSACVQALIDWAANR